jgi:hypothetical protein
LYWWLLPSDAVIDILSIRIKESATEGIYFTKEVNRAMRKKKHSLTRRPGLGRGKVDKVLQRCFSTLIKELTQ